MTYAVMHMYDINNKNTYNHLLVMTKNNLRYEKILKDIYNILGLW